MSRLRLVSGFAAVAFTLGACGDSDTDNEGSSAPIAVTEAPNADSGEVSSRIDIGEAAPTQWDPEIDVAGGVVWVTWGDRLIRIDPSTETPETVVDSLSPVHRAEEPQMHGRLAVGDGTLWLLDRDADLLRIDAATATVTDTIDLGATPLSVAVGETSVWVILAPEDLVRIDIATLEVTPSVKLPGVLFPGRGATLAFGHGALWVTASGALTRVDPVSGAVVSIPVKGDGCGPLAIRFAAARVWAATSDGDLTGIDPVTNTANAYMSIQGLRGGPIFNLAGSDDAIWVTRASSLLQKIPIEDPLPPPLGLGQLYQ